MTRKMFGMLTTPVFIPLKHNGIRWRVDLVAHFKIFKQLEKEAGGQTGDKWKDYDALLVAAGKHEIGLETDTEV